VRRARDDRGSGLVELAWLALILIVPLVYVVLTVFAVQRGAFATDAAARAAGRAYALAPSDAAGEVRARSAVAQALADQGLPGEDWSLEIDCTPQPDRCHQGGSVVTVVVHTRVGLPLLPRILGHGGGTVALDATDRVPVGQYQVSHAP
jgi:Flp pilus assembly protein TadG